MELKATMTTFMYLTVSTVARARDISRVESLVREYEFTVEPTISGDKVSFGPEANSAFDVYRTPERREIVTREFLERLVPLLRTSLEIRCIETQGEELPDAWKWEAVADGDADEEKVELTQL